MAFVFVHGVNTREGAVYKVQKEIIQKFMHKHLNGAVIGGKTLSFSGKQCVTFPYWGHLGAKLAWDGASLPPDSLQNFGVSDSETQLLLAQLREALPADSTSEPLAALARQDFGQALDLLIDYAVANATEETKDSIAAFAVEASALDMQSGLPDWLKNVQTDSDFISALSLKLQKRSTIESYGGITPIYELLSKARLKLAEAMSRVATSVIVERVGDFASTKILTSTRRPLNDVLGIFFGDVFFYFAGRGDPMAPGPICSELLSAFNAAWKSLGPNEPLVILGHSLGGVISFDLLSHFCPHIEVDLFVSVGSQVAHFEELKLYAASDPTLSPPKQASTPLNIKRWMNIYDDVDLFAYSANQVFDRVDVDARYDTRTYAIRAHGAYFRQERFYQRFRERLENLK